MARTLLRRPDGPAEFIADAVRALALVSVVVAAIGWGPVEGLSVALVLGGMMLPRPLGLRPGFDIAFGIVLLVAVWSSVLEIYITTRWWDLPVHFVANGLCAAVGYVLLARFGVVADAATLPRPMLSTALVTTFLGVTIGVIWELFEWFGHTYIDEEIYVGYEDTLGDLVVGALGSLVAGLTLRVLMAPRSTTRERVPRER
jgi:hypothetical protein